MVKTGKILVYAIYANYECSKKNNGDKLFLLFGLYFAGYIKNYNIGNKKE
jgi:hypothetical protein